MCAAYGPEEYPDQRGCRKKVGRILAKGQCASVQFLHLKSGGMEPSSNLKQVPDVAKCQDGRAARAAFAACKLLKILPVSSIHAKSAVLVARPAD